MPSRISIKVRESGGEYAPLRDPVTHEPQEFATMEDAQWKATILLMRPGCRSVRIYRDGALAEWSTTSRRGSGTLFPGRPCALLPSRFRKEREE